MKPADLLKAAVYPLTELSVLFALLGFWALIALAGNAGVFGIWLTVIIVPALLRYQMLLLETRARGKDPQPPGIEFFNIAHESWSLFPVVVAVLVVWAAYSIYSSAGMFAMLLFLAVAGTLYPAILGVLAITHSPLQSMNPVAVFQFILYCGTSYLVAPVYLLLIAYFMTMLRGLNEFVTVFLEMFFVFSLHSVIGSVIEPHNMVDDVYIPDATEADADEVQGDIEKNRTAVLAHAYGFISRDNREGGFRHIFGEIEKDPVPVAAWAWYFDNMLRWEEQQHALFFAQQYIHDMLAHGESIPALKVILRCRTVNERFKPLHEDMPAAIQAAEDSGNIELATVLKQG